MIPVDDRTYGLGDIAQLLNAAPITAWRWVRRLGYERTGRGYGRAHSVTHTDLMICRAWQVINDVSLTGHRPLSAPQTTLCRNAEVAIRFGPRRWLLVNQRHGQTFNTAEFAALVWAESSDRTAWLIDLEPWKGD